MAHPGKHLGERIEKNRGKGHRHRYEGKVKRISVDSSYTVEDQLETVGDTLYAYNEDGYLSSKVAPEGTTHYTYGTLGELKSVVLPDNTTIEYLHNANNQRVAKKVDGVVTEKYLWADLTTLLAVYNADDSLKIRFEYADGRMPYKMTYEGQSYYLAYDQVGTLQAVADGNGNVVKALTYDTFGNLFSDSNPDMEVPFGFAGGVYDEDTGLTRFGYRDYDPVTGKWTAKDPIGFKGGDTNLYGYVLNDPVNFIDPYGLSPLDYFKCLYYTYKISPYIEECNQQMTAEEQYDNLFNNDTPYVGSANYFKCFQKKDPELFDNWQQSCGGASCKK